MTETVEERPYVLRTVVLDDGEERPIEAYSNMPEKTSREWPVFTRDQMPALLDATIREHFQPIWIDAIQNFVVVTGYQNSLPVPFDIEPFMDRVLKEEEIDEYQEGNGFNIGYAKKDVIEVEGDQLDVFSFDSVDYYFCRALEPVRAPVVGRGDPRPYALTMVAFDSGNGDDDEDKEEDAVPAYSNSSESQYVFPVFTREQVDGLLQITQRSQFQPFWIEEIGTYAVVVAYDSPLPEQFDIEPYMAAILQMTKIDEYRDGDGFWLAYAEKYVIEVDGTPEEAFSFHPADLDFYRVEAPGPSATL